MLTEIIPSHIFILLTLCFLISYFIGSIPFGLILTRVWGYGDIRNVGSGNIGATNVLRTGNRFLALIVLILDSFKGFVVINLLSLFIIKNNIEIILLIGVFGCVIGHCYPLWLKFKGGKGVATSLGAFIGFDFFIGFLICIIWLITAFFYRKSSLASLISLSCSPFIVFIFYGYSETVLTLFTFLVICLKHKENIKRLTNGNEPKLFSK